MASVWDKLLTEERRRKSSTGPKPGDEKNAFLSDYYRVVFSSAFRRLQDKTQVTPLAPSDYVRRRLTHSVEVATVGERMGRVLAHNIEEIGPDRAFHVGKVVATACLLHDIGNPPFGHKGEKAIARWAQKHLPMPPEKSDENASATADVFSHHDLHNFDGNPQGFRIATRLHHHGEAFGMNLTAATLAATVKYPKKSGLGVEKFACFVDDQAAMDWVWEQTGLDEGRRHPLTLVVEAADDIVNRLVDIEDALKLSYLSFDQIRATLSNCGPLGAKLYGTLMERYGLLKDRVVESERQQLAYQHFRVAATSVMSREVEEAFRINLDDIHSGAFGADQDLLKKSGAADLYKALKKLEYGNIFDQASILRVEAGGIHAVEWLLDRVLQALTDEDDDLRQTIDPTPSHDGDPDLDDDRRCVQRTIDYVAGMTDRYAVNLYRQLSGVAL